MAFWTHMARRVLWSGVLAVVGLCVMAQSAFAVDRYVAPGGVDANDCVLPAEPCGTIGFAVGEAGSNDHVKVAGGTYTEGVFNIVFKLRLTGGYDPDGPGGWDTSSYTTTPTIIDGEDSSRLIVITTNTANGTVVEHVTLRNGNATNALNDAEHGGAMVIRDVSNVVLTNVRFVSNRASNNATGNGGALALLKAGSVTLDRVFFMDNVAPDLGGAIYVNTDAGQSFTLNLQSTLIARNQAERGGAIQTTGPGKLLLSLRHVTLADNSLGSKPADEAIHFAAGSNGAGNAHSLQFSYSLITGNPTGIRSALVQNPVIPTSGILFGLDVDTPWTGTLPALNPGTKRSLPFIDPDAGNYRPADGSAAIDIAGNTNKTDLDGRERGSTSDCTPRTLCPLGKADDYGAYEYVYTGPVVRYVAETGTDSSNNCLNADLPCLTPGRANSYAMGDDETRIAQGTYATAVAACNTAVLCMTEAYTVTGGFVPPNWTTPAADPALTTFDGTDQRSGITVNYDQADARALLQNLRVVNGYSLANGGGIGINTNNAGPAQNLAIRNCLVEDSRGDSSGDGGGIYANAPVNLEVTNCILRNNSVPDGRGGGLGITDANGVATYTLQDLEVYGNQAKRPNDQSANGGRGGGLFLEGVGLLQRSEVYSNSADFTGGGVSTGSNGAFPTIHRTIIRDNEAAVGGGFSIYLTGGATVQNSLIIRNKATATQGVISGQSNVPNLGGNGVHSPHAGAADKPLRLINVTIADNVGATPDAMRVQEGSRPNNLLNVLISGNAVGIQSDNGGVATLTKVQIADDVTTKTTGFGVGDLTGTPLGGAAGFVGGGDYQLLASAPGVDAGETWTGDTAALDGKNRPLGAGFDLGAYERSKTNLFLPALQK